MKIKKKKTVYEALFLNFYMYSICNVLMIIYFPGDIRHEKWICTLATLRLTSLMQGVTASVVLSTPEG